MSESLNSAMKEENGDESDEEDVSESRNSAIKQE